MSICAKFEVSSLNKTEKAYNTQRANDNINFNNTNNSKMWLN